MTNINKVSALEKGTLCGAVMTGDYNLIEATYKSTLQKLVNRVLITDKNNNVIKTVEDADLDPEVWFGAESAKTE